MARKMIPTTPPAITMMIIQLIILINVQLLFIPYHYYYCWCQTAGANDDGYANDSDNKKWADQL